MSSIIRDREKLVSLNLEREVIAAFLKYSDLFYEVEPFMSERDFDHPFHSTCFCVIKETYSQKKKLDKVLLAQKIINIGLTKCEEIDTYSYIENISYITINKDAGKQYCFELNKLKKLRDLLSLTYKSREFILSNKDKDLDYIYSEVDKLNNEIIQKHEYQTNPVNIFENIQEVVQERVDNPPDDFLKGPFGSINRIYGTLLPPAGINLIGARTGVSKTAISMFYLLWIAEKYDLPILHLDFSEMTKQQLQFRAITIFTGGIVPYHSLVRGTWNRNPEWIKLVQKAYKKVEKLKMFYYDVGSLSEKQQLSLIRRVYYSQVGRGKLMLLNYDYLKPFSPDDFNTPEWKQMGHFIQDYKSLVNNEIPEIRTWMSLQLNRSGITNNKASSQIDDSENSFGMSDRIIQQCTSAFLLRRKAYDELTNEGNRFGNLKLIPLKFREVLGDDYKRHFDWVKMLNGAYRTNYINLNMSSFYFEDKGDLHDMVRIMSNIQPIQPDNNHQDIHM